MKTLKRDFLTFFDAGSSSCFVRKTFSTTFSAGIATTFSSGILASTGLEKVDENDGGCSADKEVTTDDADKVVGNEEDTEDAEDA
jgi:hypothetical protein